MEQYLLKSEQFEESIGKKLDLSLTIINENEKSGEEEDIVYEEVDKGGKKDVKKEEERRLTLFIKKKAYGNNRV